MAGIGPTLPPNRPTPLTRTNRDGGGSGGGSYNPQRQGKDEEHDEAEISPEALQRLAEKSAPKADAEPATGAAPGPSSASIVKPQAPAAAQPGAANARLEIISEIQDFNTHHAQAGSRLSAKLVPIPGGSALHIADADRGVTLKPFGDRDIFHFAFQEVRTKLQAFDRSAGSHFDGVV